MIFITPFQIHFVVPFNTINRIHWKEDHSYALFH